MGYRYPESQTPVEFNDDISKFNNSPLQRKKIF